MSAAPYAQIFANPALNSVAGASLDPAIKPRAGEPITLNLPDSELEDQVRWLLAGQDPYMLLAVGRLHYWLVDLQLGEAVAFDYVSEHTLFAFLPDGRYAYRPGSILLVRQPVPYDPEGEEERGERAVIPTLNHGSECLAFAPVGDEAITALQNFGNPHYPMKRTVAMARKPLSRSRGDMTWSTEIEGRGWRSPVLADGTIALHLQDGVHYISPDGQEAATYPISLVPAHIAADEKNFIWGYQPGDDDGLELLSLSTAGVRSAAVPVLGEPTQPPIPLPDGSVGVVTGLGVMSVDNGALEWEKALPGGSDLRATGTRDMHLLVKGADMLTLLRKSQHRIWSLRAPEGAHITSNPVVTADGGVCFAAGLKVFQLER